MKGNFLLFFNKIIFQMTTILELNRIKPIMENQLQQQNFEEMIKYTKIYNDLKNQKTSKFCNQEFSKFDKIFQELESKAKEQFELGISQNNKLQINQSSQVLSLLHTQENIFQKIQDYFSKKLQLQIDSLEFTFEPEESYNFPFFKQYIKLLELMAENIQQYKENIIQSQDKDKLLLVIEYQINNILDDKLKYIFDKFQEYFQEKPVQEIDFYCEEIAQISNQNENFATFILTIFKENDFQHLDIIENRISQFQMNIRIMELLDKYLVQSQKLVRYQLQYLVDHSSLINKTINFDISFFETYRTIEESLDNQNDLLEYVDDIFMLAQSCVNRSFSTLNKNYICGMVNYMSETFFGKSVVHILKSMVNVYVNQDYIQSGLTCFKSTFSTHNVILINLLNTVSIFQSYFQKMRQSWIQEYEDWFTEKSTMVISCLENFQLQNQKIYSDYLSQIVYKSVEYLFPQMQNELEQFLAQIQRSNQQNSGKSQQFIKNMLSYLRQFKTQLSSNVFEIFMNDFCKKFSDALEKIIRKNRYNQMMALILDMVTLFIQEIRKIMSSLQDYSNMNFKKIFQRIKIILEILMQEQFDADILQDGTYIMLVLTNEEVQQIGKLRIEP